MKEYYPMINDTFHYKKIGFLIFLIFFVQRFFYVAKGLPYYSLDENEIVEYSIGYMGGDLNPYWFKYGPLFSYVLAFIFYIQSIFSPGTLNEFVEFYFENPSNFYLTARILSQIFHLGLAIMAYKITKEFISKSAAPLSFAIGLIPFVDSMTGFYARVDSLLALNFSVAIYFALHFFKSNHWKWYILTGIFVGASLATKPLPALLILPPIYVIWLMSEVRRSKKVNFLILKKIGSSLVNLKLYALVFFIFFGTFIFHPYSFLDFKSFFDEQLNTFKSDSEAPWAKGFEIGTYSHFGLPFLISTLGSLIYCLTLFKKKNYLILISLIFFVLFYWLFFVNKPIREYYYLPIFSILFALISYSIHDLISKFHLNTYLRFLFLTVLIFFISFSPFKNLLTDFKTFGIDKQRVLDSDQKDAQFWILDNIPYNTKILFYGYYTSLPRLIDPNPEEQARYGDYFMYQRWKNKYLIERFNSFMSKYNQQQKPTYDIIYNLNITTNQGNKSFYTRYDMEQNEQYLLQICQDLQIQYIVTDNDLYQYDFMNQYQVWPTENDKRVFSTVRIYKIL